MIQRLRQRGPDGDIVRDIDHGPHGAGERNLLRQRGYLMADTMPNAMRPGLWRVNGQTFDYSKHQRLNGSRSFVRGPRRAA